MRPTRTNRAAKEVTRGTKKRPCREDTVMVAAYFKTPVSLAWRALVATLSLERGRRVSGQEALAEAMLDYFIKHDQTPPAELIAAVKPASPISAGPTPKARKSALVSE
jgi:hypothetical protein